MKFTKEILRPGTYPVPTPTGKRWEYFPADRVKRIHETLSRMLSDGLSIPIPGRHLPEAVPVRRTSDKDDVDSYNNAGFLAGASLGNDGSLYAVLDVKDAKFAESIKNGSIKHVSPVVASKWLNTETGAEYDDAITHVALVTHPVQLQQGDFVLSEDQVAFSLADYACLAAPGSVDFTGQLSDTSVNEGSLQQLLTALEQFGILLPDGTNAMNLVDRLTVAVMNARSRDDMADNVVTKAPKGSQVKSDPAISYAGVAFSQEQMDAVKQLTDQNNFLIQFAQSQVRTAYENRIKAAIQTGRCSADEANKHLVPQLGGLEIKMSQDGTTSKQPLDYLLDMIEAREPASSVNLANDGGKVKFSIGGMTIADPPPESDPNAPDPDQTDMSAEEAEKKFAEVKSMIPMMFAG